MIHAREDYNRIQDPEGLIPEDEPVFLIRAQDPNFPAAVKHYAKLAEDGGAADDLVNACINHAKLGEKFQAENPEAVHTPDL